MLLVPGRAARLWGAAEALREATDERRWPVFQRSYAQAFMTAQPQLPPVGWAAAWTAGRGAGSDGGTGGGGYVPQPGRTALADW